MSDLAVNREQISVFVDTLFAYASEGGHVSLRAFLENEDGPPVSIRPVKINGEGLKPVARWATLEATKAARHLAPVVFCPPIATFNSDRTASEKDLLEAFALSVECDQGAQSAKTKLEAILGPATVTVASGGEWADSETGELQPKLHLHWRLTEPASGPDLAKLKEARRFATGLVGGDPTNVPIVHPIRWPGTWHRKREPKLAEILELNERAEIDLEEALERLREARASAGPAPKGSDAARSETTARADDREISELVRGVVTGEKLHPNLVPLAARMVGSGMHPGATVNMLRGLMEGSSAPRDERWKARYDDIPRDVSTAQAKFKPEPTAEREKPGLIDLINPAKWEGQPPPLRDWTWNGWIPSRQATYLTGAGSSGKSLVSQQLATATALGRPFLGVETQSCVSAYFTCEDDPAELHRRQAAICEAFSIDFPELSGRLYLASLAGELGNELATFDAQNRMHKTEAWERLRATVLKIGARFIVLDNVAHLFAGNENIRNHVAAFCGLLNGLAAEAGAAILLIGHPNKAGGEFSGSTAWENQVRSRLFLDTPQDGEGAPVDPDLRTLSRAKSNYARRGEALEFRWYRWAFVPNTPDATVGDFGAHQAETLADERFLACLDQATEERRTTSASRSAANYAPRVFLKMPCGKGMGLKAYESALNRLLSRGVIVNDQPVYKRPNRAWALGLGRAQTPAQSAHEPAHEACTNPHIGEE